MSMPRCVSARLECDTRATHAGRIGRLKERINSYAAGKVLSRSFAGRLCSIPLEFHLNPPIDWHPTQLALSCRAGFCSTCCDIARNADLCDRQKNARESWQKRARSVVKGWAFSEDWRAKRVVRAADGIRSGLGRFPCGIALRNG